MSSQAFSSRLQCLEQTHIIGPELMMGVLQSGLKYFECLRWRDRVAREGRVRQDPDERRLREGAGRPTGLGVICKPVLHAGVSFVRRPHQGQEDVDIKQVDSHSPFASRSRTCFVVMRGESSGKSNTRIPFTNLVACDAVIPLRTSTETALTR